MSSDIASVPGGELQVTPVSEWQPARKFPENYPGKFPRTSYLLCNDRVHPILPGDGPSVTGFALRQDGNRQISSCGTDASRRCLTAFRYWPMVPTGIRRPCISNCMTTGRGRVRTAVYRYSGDVSAARTLLPVACMAKDISTASC